MKLSLLPFILLLASPLTAQTLKLGSPSLISDGSTVPDLHNLTNFGPVTVGETKSDYHYFLHTKSPVTLITTPTITGPDAADFQFLIHPNEFSIAPDEPSIFDIRFTPTSPGLKNATVTITSSALDDTGEYTFAISGTGVDGPVPSAPDLWFGSEGSIRIKAKADKKTGKIKVQVQNNIPNLGTVPSGPAVVRYYFSQDYVLGPEDTLLNEIPLKPIAIAKQTKKGLKYKTGKAKLKALVPNKYGNLFMQVEIIESSTTEQTYWWNTVYHPLEFYIK